MASGKKRKACEEPAGEQKLRKEAQLVIRLDTALREAFVNACQADDTSASRELRRFMRRYLKERRAAGTGR